MRVPLGGFLLVLVLIAAQLGWYSPRLPQTVISSFALDGSAGGWSPRGTFLATYVIVVAVTAASFLLLPPLLRRLGGQGLNIPHRDYWLAPERADATMEHIARQLVWFGLVTVAFLGWTHQLVILANLGGEGRMASAPFWAGLAAFLAYAAWWTLRLTLRFQRRPR
ncbi:MAG TPA: hypothetical protein PLH84_14085 [Candidatus Krumholzibacteria bacterium]|nr:hypothetical protein [Candidatus Krumholzibacteria bacterium]